MDAQERWDYEYVASPALTRAGKKKRTIPGGGPNLFKAKKTGPASFEGDYKDFPASAWDGYDAFAATPHPANIEYHHPNGAPVPRPTGMYKVSGDATGGAVNTTAWRSRIAQEKDAEKNRLLAANPQLAGAADAQARTSVAARYGMSWTDLYLVDWEEHHIKPVNWGGRDGKANMIYLRGTEHDKFTGLFNSLKTTIMKDIP